MLRTAWTWSNWTSFSFPPKTKPRKHAHMKPFDTDRLVRYGQFQSHVQAARRRVLWLWSAFAAWLGLLLWLCHRFGALLLMLIGLAAAAANLTLHVPEPSFVASLEEATNVAGPWSNVITYYDACPNYWTFVIPIATNTSFQLKSITPGFTNGSGSNGMFQSFSRFYRVRLHDNGLVYTPWDVRATQLSASRIGISSTLLFRCDDTQVGPFYVYRSVNGDTNFSYIGQTANSGVSFTDSNLSVGTYSYKMRVLDGTNISFFSAATAPITL